MVTIPTKFRIWFGVLAALIIMGIIYWLHSIYYPGTDDAYVDANVVDVAAQVSGPVSAIYIQNHQYVHKGQLLFTIDPRPFQYAVNKANADVQLATQTMEANEDAVKIARAQVKENQAQFNWAKKNAWREMTLAKSGDESLSAGDQAKEQWLSAKSQLNASQNQLIKAIQTLGTPGENNAQILQAKAELQNAQLNLGYTKVYAPADGYIDNFTLRIGSTITAQQLLFELVESDQWWVDANYKETDLKRIKPGQKAVITVDSYPGVKFHGYVNSVAHGSGSAFSLLPPENATGNWVKVTQRFPVKIIITDPNPHHPLRVGASSQVTIDTLHKANEHHA